MSECAASVATSSSYEAHAIRLLNLTQGYRGVEATGTRELQLHEGRPDQVWSICNGTQCNQEVCVPEIEQRWDLQWRQYAEDGASGPEYVWQTLDKLCDVVWPGASTTADKMSRHMMLGSFFNSIPVRNAFIYFRNETRYCGIKFQHSELEAAIREVTPFVESIIRDHDSPKAHALITWYLGTDYLYFLKELKPGDFVVKFMLMCEMWRQHPHKRSKTWQFGSPRVICDLLGGILMGLMTLQQHGIMIKMSLNTIERQNDAWARWIEAYPLCAIMDNPDMDEAFLLRSASRPNDVPGETETEVLEEVGYLGGVGTYTPTVLRKVSRTWYSRERA